MTCYPLTLELVVETQYPAPEATASGLVFFVGQIVGAVTMPVANLLATSASAADLEINTCGGGGRNGESGDGDLSSTIEPTRTGIGSRQTQATSYVLTRPCNMILM